MDVLEAVRDELIDGGLGLSSGTCYVTALTAFVAGSPPFHVQVVDNGETREGDAGGNTLGERVSVKVSVFVHMALDQEGRTEQVLIKESAGLKARALAIRALLNGNWLEVQQGRTVTRLLEVPLYWQETMAAEAHPVDPTWVRKDLVFVGYKFSRSA